MQATYRHLASTVVAFVAVTLASIASADQWLPARPKSYASANGEYRLTVTPRALAGALPYFSDKVEGKVRAGQRAGGPSEPRGLLERKQGSGWTRVWDAALVNDVSPVHAVVANNGSRVVTFDNWHSMGHGPDVVVVYDGMGRHLKSFGLKDLLPADYIKALPHSVSSIRWGGEHRISGDGARLMLQVVVPSERFSDHREFVEVEVDLVALQVFAPTGPEWAHALQAVQKTLHARALRDAEAASRADAGESAAAIAAADAAAAAADAAADAAEAASRASQTNQP